MSGKATDPLYGRFTEVADALVGAPSQSPPPRRVDSWDVRAEKIFARADMRLDATAYDPAAAAAIAGMTEEGITFKPLSSFARVFYRGRFRRIWAKDAKHGLPYFNTTDLLSILVLGSEPRYLSKVTDTDIDALLVRHSWLLMTCSGTVGRVFYVPKRLDGWVATHDIMRIVAHDSDDIGYLYAWLHHPVARAQILSYGTQVDHLTDKQVESLPVPVLPPADTSAISKEVVSALEARERAADRLAKAWPR